ncbi:hypothetical protein [Cellulomonas palmilytica]|uniref:hypothetical protein n=1 Tax=Cellulomonas palmilytica TaxID=2608402 RepID=UPI001F198085|nr:hypothetical protein [Cellulomonas palmilytica]UJP39832.1 hypothetical protein F1D97_16320 [Cellulomonas palmilytica]
MGGGLEARAESLERSASALLGVMTTLRPADPSTWAAGTGAYGFTSLADAMAEARTQLTQRIDDVEGVTVGCGIRLQECATAYREADERVQQLFQRLLGALGVGG